LGPCPLVESWAAVVRVGGAGGAAESPLRCGKWQLTW
jgi:hypothetical protein